MTVFIDYNRVQLLGEVDKSMRLEPFESKWKNFGWNTIAVNGHNIQDICQAIDEAKDVRGSPTVIITKTVKGKGVSFMENRYEWHNRAPNKEEYERARLELKQQEGVS